MDRERLADACRALPLFPLPGTLLFPGSLLPLHVFEPRYRALVADCLRDERPLSVCQIRPSEIHLAAGSPGILPYAAVGIIAAHELLADGRSNILIQPIGRVRIDADRATDTLYRIADAELLVDRPVTAAELAARGEELRTLLLPVLTRGGDRAANLIQAVRSLPAERVPEAIASVVLSEDDARQAWLAEDDPLRRADLVEAGILARIAQNQPAAEA